jgi:hypothetical protein
MAIAWDLCVTSGLWAYRIIEAGNLKFKFGIEVITNSMKQSHSWEASSSLASREIPRIFGIWGFVTEFARVDGGNEYRRIC